jgi:hypothetical protein
MRTASQKYRHHRGDISKTIVKMLTEQIDTMHGPEGVIARLMVPKPLPQLRGKKMIIPLIGKRGG